MKHATRNDVVRILGDDRLAGDLYAEAARVGNIPVDRIFSIGQPTVGPGVFRVRTDVDPLPAGGEGTVDGLAVTFDFARGTRPVALAS